MSTKIFPTAQDAQNAFYEALERCDLEGMMAVWSEDEDIVCVHPAGQRLAGQAEVREVWRQMFAGGPNMRVRITEAHFDGGNLIIDRVVPEGKKEMRYDDFLRGMRA